MKLPVLLVILSGTVLTGCLTKVPPQQRAHDSWRQTSEQLSRPTTLN